MEASPRSFGCGCACPSISSPQMKAAGFALLAIASRVVFFITTPIWLDFFKPINYTSLHNVTVTDFRFRYENETTTMTPIPTGNGSCSRSANPYFAVLGQWSFSLVVFAIVLLLIVAIRPERIRSDVERSYPIRNFVMIGCSQGLSSMFMAYAVSGSRTPPYLQAILINLAIPVQFIVRFAVLRKRPSLLKGISAGVVVLTEFACLIPTIFPSLENTEQHLQEGGSTGLDRFLWPTFFVLSLIPFAMANSLMERSVQTKKRNKEVDEEPEAAENSAYEHLVDNSENHSTAPLTTPSAAAAPSSPSSSSQSMQLDLVYFSFWWNLFVVLTLMALFWVDVLPVIGTSSSISEFGCLMWFNLRCLFGGADCPVAVSLLGWMDFGAITLANFAFAGLMRHSEGANFVMVVMTIRTPIIFLFWTLFVEQPFAWHPHASLSTWLSIGAIVVMIIAIVIYSRAPSEVVHSLRDRRPADDNEDFRALVTGSVPINDDDDDAYSRSMNIQSQR